jgi:hypothetical protein
MPVDSTQVDFRDGNQAARTAQAIRRERGLTEEMVPQRLLGGVTQPY